MQIMKKNNSSHREKASTQKLFEDNINFAHLLLFSQ